MAIGDQLLDLAAYERALWQARFTTFGSTDPTALRQGYRRLENLQRLIQMAKPYFTHQLDLAVQQISDEQEGLHNRPEALRDPALARAVDLLKGLAVVRLPRS